MEGGRAYTLVTTTPTDRSCCRTRWAERRARRPGPRCGTEGWRNTTAHRGCRTHRGDYVLNARQQHKVCSWNRATSGQADGQDAHCPRPPNTPAAQQTPRPSPCHHLTRTSKPGLFRYYYWTPNLLPLRQWAPRLRIMGEGIANLQNVLRAVCERGTQLQEGVHREDRGLRELQQWAGTQNNGIARRLQFLYQQFAQFGPQTRWDRGTGRCNSCIKQG